MSSSFDFVISDQLKFLEIIFCHPSFRFEVTLEKVLAILYCKTAFWSVKGRRKKLGAFEVLSFGSAAVSCLVFVIVPKLG